MPPRRNDYIVPTYGGPIVTDLRFRRGFLGERAVLKHHHLPSWQEGQAGGIVIHVSSLADVASVYAEVEESGGHLAVAADPAELEQIAGAGRIALMICASYEDVGQNPELLAVYDRLGAVSFALAQNPRNVLVDGCSERTQAGLSSQGIAVVKDLRRRGILIDISHTSDRGFWDVLESVDGGVIASHSNARSLCDNPRNLSDEMIRALAEHDGLIGISTYPTLLTNDSTATLEHALDHIEHIAGLAGAGRVAVGADFITFALELVLPKIRATDFQGSLYGSDYRPARELASIADLPKLGEGLRRRGFNDEQIDGVLAANFLRTWSEARAHTARA